MARRQRHKTVREYINAQPRTKTQGQIALELGISDSQLSRLKSGQRIGLGLARRLAPKLGMSAASLMGIEDREKVI